MSSDRDNEDARPRAASVFDVARLAGVSHQTVSRVLNDHPSLRAATRQKVLDAMRELDYRPNAAARALSSSRSRLIGILSTSSGEYGPATIVAAVGAAARSRGYSVTIANADGLDRSSVDAAVSHLANLSAEGLIVVAPQTQVLAALEGLSIPLPYVTLQATGGSGSHGGMLDQVLGARLATAHLLDLEHDRVGHIAGPSEWLDAQQRLTGFGEELRLRNLDPGFVEVGDWSAASGFHAASDLIRQGVTAIFAGNDQMALGALSASASLGIRVPHDLSIVGFDDIPEAAYYQPALTTVRQDLIEAGRRALALLLGDGDVRPAVGPELIVRASTAAPPTRPRPSL